MPRHNTAPRRRRSAKEHTRRIEERFVSHESLRQDPDRPDCTIIGVAAHPRHQVFGQNSKAATIVDLRPPPPPRQISTASFRAVLNDGYARRRGM